MPTPSDSYLDWNRVHRGFAVLLLLASRPELITAVLQVVQRLLTRHLLGCTGLKADKGQGGAVSLIQRFGSTANLNIHLHCLVLGGVYRCGDDGIPRFVAVAAPTDEELQTLGPLRAAAMAYRIAFGTRGGHKLLTLRGSAPREMPRRQHLCAGRRCSPGRTKTRTPGPR